MAMTPTKRHQARARQEAMQKARKDQRLGLAKKQQRKREENNFFPPQKKLKKVKKGIDI